MSSQTALGFPFPVTGDPVASLDTILESLADFINDHVGLHCGDRGIFPFAATPNTQTVAIVFPVGLFTVAADIMVTANIQSADPAQNFSTIVVDGAPTLTGANLKCHRSTGAAGNVTFHWHAMQIAP